MWTARASLAVLAIGLGALTPVAQAAGSSSQGVHVDPGSPAGKQYAIPINTARGETSGGRGSGRGSPASFGVGVTATTTTSATTSAPARRHRPRTHKRRRADKIRARRASAKPSATSRAVVSAASSRGTGWLPLLTGGALVLVLAGGGGLLLRRRL